MTIVDSKVSYLHNTAHNYKYIPHYTEGKCSHITAIIRTTHNYYNIESDETDDESSMVELETWYFGNIDSTLARTKCKKDGDFLVRFSIDM